MEDSEFELKKGFIEEVAQLHDEAEHCFLDLERRPNDQHIVDKIFRIAHNIKGSAAAVGFGHLSKLAHHLESLLLDIKTSRLSPGQEIIDLLLRVNDELKKAIQTLQSDITSSLDFSELIIELSNAAAGAPSSHPVTRMRNHSPVQTGFVSFEDVCTPLLSSLEKPIHETKQEHTSIEALTGPRHDPHAGKSFKDESVRVSLTRIDRLMNNVGELVILDTVLAEQSQLLASANIRKTIGQMGKIIREVQQVSMSFRMVPLRQLFQKMQRIVRDTSVTLGKNVNLSFSGEETEIDKTIVEQLSDPLVHIVRNAVDHGIECSERRRELGKDPLAKVHLEAYHRGDSIVIEIKDDGQGINFEAVRRKALSQGLITPDSELSEEEITNLIFTPGFSTKETLSDISGRGVGMDVVRTNIEALHGDIKVHSTAGSGTSFALSVPLTLGIIEGVTVRVAAQSFVVPLTQVLESIQPQAEQINSVAGTRSILSLRGKAMPLYSLAELIELKESHREPSALEQGIILILARGKDDLCGIVVDEILGQQQIVIKSLGEEFNGLPGLSGAAILADGRPVPILDLIELIDQNKRQIGVPKHDRRAA